jgi:hypothetical protein
MFHHCIRLFNTLTRKSTSGFVTRIGGTAMTWQSKKQPIVALSSTEAEYTALTETAKEVTLVIWIFSLPSVGKCVPTYNVLKNLPQ